MEKEEGRRKEKEEGTHLEGKMEMNRGNCNWRREDVQKVRKRPADLKKT
jgi:hypothetical protein